MKPVFRLTAFCMALLMCLLVCTSCLKLNPGTQGGETPDDPTDDPTGGNTASSYEVVFKANDTVLKTETVEPGAAATAPEDDEVPARDGYEFTGWDVAFDNVQANLTVNAVYARLWSVAFASDSGALLETVYVRDGEAAVAPDASVLPVRNYMTFLGWDKSFNRVTSDMTVKAIYGESGLVTVTFRDHDGSVIETVSAPWGSSVTAPATPTHAGCSFVEWEGDFDKVTENISVTAVCRESGKKLVKFYDYDGTLLWVTSVSAGEAAEAPGAPARANYQFAGWDKSIDSVTADMEVKATYTENKKFTVTYVANKKTVATEEVYIGTAAHPPVAPDRRDEGYIFSEWAGDYQCVEKDITVTAKYVTYMHQVTFETSGGSVVADASIREGRKVTKPANPTRSGYNFIEWQYNGDKYDFSTPVTKDIVLVALWESDGSVPAATNKTVTLNPGKNLEVWQNMTLQFGISPTSDYTKNFIGGSSAAFQFTSSNPDIVEVQNDGTIKTGDKIGNAQIYATATSAGSLAGASVSRGDVLAYVTVTVVETPAYYKKALESEDQQITLEAAKSNRINKNDFLSYPTGGYGAANVALWFQDRQATLTMTVDDNLNIMVDHAEWMELYEAYGIPVTFIANNDTSKLYPDEITYFKEIIAAGCDVQTHGADHLNNSDTAPTARVWYEMYFGQKKLSQLTGFGSPVIGYPNGRNNGAISSYLFIGGRGVYGTPNTVDRINYNEINSISEFHGVTAQQRMDELFGGSFSNGWMNILYHGLTDTLSEEVRANYDIMKPYVDDGRLWATTLVKAFQYAQSRDTATVTVVNATPNTISFVLSDRMNDLLYTHPLTVRMMVNGAWDHVRAFQNGQEIFAHVVEKDGETYVVVDAVPDAGEVTLVRTDEDGVPVDGSILPELPASEEKYEFYNPVTGNMALLTRENLETMMADITARRDSYTDEEYRQMVAYYNNLLGKLS